jgi:restriction endonuclease Mrr
MTPFGCSGASSDTFIDYTKIEPLVMDHIVVKAKKLKEPRKGLEGKG